MGNIFVRTLITILALGLLILHLFYLDNIDEIAIALLVIVILPWLYIIFEKIEWGQLKAVLRRENIAKPHKGDIKKEKLPEGLKLLPFHEEVEEEFDISKDIKYFTFKARINYPHEAGAGHVLKIFINDNLIAGHLLTNKPQIKEIGDGRKGNWFDQGKWRLVFSPDFQNNFYHKIYNVVNGDPYRFKFDISDIVKVKDKLVVRFIHDGDDNNPAHKNPIVISDIRLY